MANVVHRYAREKFLALAALPLATDDLIVYAHRHGRLQPVPLSTVRPPDPATITWNRAGGETVGND